MDVYVTSFSYKRGMPPDPKGDGGGYVFDCRALPNPFWVESLRKFTGRDKPVAEFMAAHQGEVEAFLKPIRELVALSIRSYAQDGRNRLSVAFGCTGGQHRSVFCAEVLAAFLRASGDCNVELVHCAQEFWKT
ncbi:MAG: hypothetical protein MJ240_09035 [Kiritimatiellae bacterium]|nr:hypothetical protein [Kiritimatiellia bacterium]